MHWLKTETAKYGIGFVIGLTLTSFILLFTISESDQVSKYKGRICIIIDDFGYSVNDQVMDFLQFEENLTLAILPGQNYTDEIGSLALIPEPRLGLVLHR